MPKQIYDVELTDTFGGEANYCWVVRKQVKARSKRGAMIAARKALELNGRWVIDMDCGDLRRYVPQPRCPICLFIS
jgi:hypothetical protein